MSVARRIIEPDEVLGRAPRCVGGLHVSLSGAEADGIAAVCRALSSPGRVRLVALLRDWSGGSVRPGDLAERTGCPVRAIDHHLRVLVAAGLVLEHRRDGQSWYALDADRLRSVLTVIGETSVTGP